MSNGTVFWFSTVKGSVSLVSNFAQIFFFKKKNWFQILNMKPNWTKGTGKCGQKDKGPPRVRALYSQPQSTVSAVNDEFVFPC